MSKIYKKLFIITFLVAGLFFVHKSAAAGNGVTITNFDINPKQVAVGATGNLTITFQLSISDPAQAKQYCNSGTFIWFVDVKATGTASQALRSGQLAWPTSPQSYNLDFTDPFTGRSNGVVNFAGVVGCGSIGGKEIVRSASVPLTIGTGEPKYSCNSNYQCVPDSRGTYTTSACGNGCGSAGTGQNYSFNIPNPLKGGATDLAGLVQIIAQWIFNLAIPIAVAMIVYAGILFLTSQGEPAKITKAKEILKYAIIGLAIILIGNGFISLIKSVLELGGTTPSPASSATPIPTVTATPVPGSGAVGNMCSRDRDCFTGLKCKNTICQRSTGNLVGEPCNGGINCDVGLACDQTSGASVIIDGQTLGTCFQTSATGGRIGDVCQKNSDCISGLNCNQICQRSGGNLNGESCLKTSNPSNCNSKACSTTGTAVDGVCVPYSGT